jgi:hypothetical protein
MRPVGCDRYAKLETAGRESRLGVEDVRRKLHEVNLGSLTIQTMVFEPAARKLHLALGKGPASAEPLRPLELQPLFTKTP